MRVRTTSAVVITMAVLLSVPSTTISDARRVGNPSVSAQLKAIHAEINRLQAEIASLQEAQFHLALLQKEVRGLRGPAGPPGARGPQGLIGPQGPQGSEGVQGAQGEQGPQGAQGVPGPAGPIGLPGLQGPVGPPGPAGATGPAGPAGSTGSTGSTSATTLASGQTITGDVATSFTAAAAGDQGGTVVNFRLPLTVAPAAVTLGPQGACTRPGIAPAGMLCLYPSRVVNVASVMPTANDVAAPVVFSADSAGFYFGIAAAIGNRLTLWQGSYAYTAP